MSWGQKGNTPNGGGPWGQPPKSGGSGNQGGNNGSNGGGGKLPPSGNDFDDLLRKGQDQFRDMFGGDGKNSGENKRAAILLLTLTLVLWLASGIYVVQTSEQGVVLRFGEYHRTDAPGLHYHFPWPFETVYTPSVTDVMKERIGADAAGNSFGGGVNESVC